MAKQTTKTNKADTKKIEAIDIKTLVADKTVSKTAIAASQKFITTGRTTKSFAIVKEWVKTGKILAAIKAREDVDKDNFVATISALYGDTKLFNTVDRAYCQRLAEQDVKKLEEWYTKNHVATAQPKTVMQRFSNDDEYKDVVVNPVVAKASKTTNKTDDAKGGKGKDKDAPKPEIQLGMFNEVVRAQISNGSIDARQMAELIRLANELIVACTAEKNVK